MATLACRYQARERFSVVTTCSAVMTASDAGTSAAAIEPITSTTDTPRTYPVVTVQRPAESTPPLSTAHFLIIFPHRAHPMQETHLQVRRSAAFTRPECDQRR